MRQTAADSIREKLGRGQPIGMDQFMTVLVDGILKRQKDLPKAMERRFSSMDVKSNYKSKNGMERCFATEAVCSSTESQSASDLANFPWDSEADKVIKSLQRDNHKTLNYLFGKKDLLKPLFDFIIKNRGDELTPFQILALHNIDDLTRIMENAMLVPVTQSDYAADMAIKAHRKMEDNWIKEIVKDCNDMGWTKDQINEYVIGIGKRIRRRIAEDSQSVSGRVSMPIDPAAILSRMLKFPKKTRQTHYDKKPRTRHYLKKKELAATT